MDWSHFRTKSESPNKAFEAFCNQLFRLWCNREYRDQIAFFNVVNGAGGDGGVESYAKLKNGNFVGLQAKWFRDPLNVQEISQIRNSITTAKTVRENISQYIVCVPRTLSDQRGRARQTERRRWNQFEQEIQEKYPDLDLKLWDEDSLERELLQTGAEGISKYWFEREEISISSLKGRFALSQNGWLKERYVPSLQGSGRISAYINTQLGEQSDRLKSKEKLSEFQNQIDNGINHINQFIQAYSPRIHLRSKKTSENNHHPSPDFLKNLKNLKDELTIIKADILELIDCVNYGVSSTIKKKENSTRINVIIEHLEKNRPRIEFSFLHHDLEESLKNISIDKISYYLESISTDLLPYNLIFSGNPGTGKTYGLANNVDRRLKENCPAILVRAKDAPICQGWGEILRKELGLSGTWDEDEIWSALEACASRTDVLRAQDPSDDDCIGNEATKVLICIDGLDESRDQITWLEKIGEMHVIIKKYPNLRFCLSGRPYVFQRLESAQKFNQYDSIKKDIEKNGCIRINIRSDGDVPVNQLFDQYIDHYHIDVTQVPWIRWAISTPLALKMFCEIYHDTTIDPHQKIRITLSKLFEEKIRRIDDELRIKNGGRWGHEDNVILMVLSKFSDFFQTNSYISRSNAIKLISDAPKSVNLIDTPTSREILDYLRDYGMLFESLEYIDDPLNPEEKTYQFAIEPLNDYLIAERAVKTIISSGSKKLPSILKDKPAAQSWAALILLSDYKILVGEENVWIGDLSDSDLDDLRFNSLSQCLGDDLERYQPVIEEKIRKSMSSCRKTIRDLIIRVSRIEKHPLGPEFLHKVLLKFSSVANRDLIFSGPDSLYSNRDEIWAGWSPNPVSSEHLFDSDSSEGMPLLFAWSLTSVDEKLRFNSRKELTHWGTNNPDEFLKLLDSVFHTNDPQMRGDIVQVASAIACLLDPDDKKLKKFAEWAFNEVFHPEKIKITRDIVVRHAGRIICERAFLGGHITANQIKKARPPYRVKHSLYPIQRIALNDDKKFSEPLSYDLSRYVLPEACRGFFKKLRRKKFNIYKRSKWSSFSHDTMKEILSGKMGKINNKIRKELGDFLEEEQKWQKAYSKAITVIDIANIPEDLLNTRRSSIPKEKNHYSKNAEKLLKTYSQTYDVDSLSPSQLTTAACLHYLKQMGWNKKQFYGKPNGEKPGEILGADIAIIRAHGPASHGERSTISNFAEKYVWCFVYEFTGYLADTLEYHGDYPDREYRVTDYSTIFNLPPNPAQELLDTNENFEIRSKRFFLPNDLASKPQINGNNRLNNLKKWIETTPAPDFYPWILPEKDHINHISNCSDSLWVTLQLSMSITEPITHGDSLIWINSFIISDNDIKLFKRDCAYKTTEFKQFVERSINENGHLKTDVSYLAPFDALWIPWTKEDLKDNHYSFKNDRIINYSTCHTTVEGHYHSLAGEVAGERSYTIPSKIIRKLLDIKKGSAKKFCKPDNSIEGFSYKCGNPYRDSQRMIFVKKEELLNNLKKSKYSIFWTIRLSRRSSMHALEEFPKMRLENDMFWIFFLDGDSFQLIDIDQKISSM